MDAARTAKRLGADEALIVYRRTREAMPAHEIEVEEAEEEGVLMRWLSTIKRAEEGKLVLEQMELDETGFPQPTGELEELEADSLVPRSVRVRPVAGRGGTDIEFRRRGQRGAEPDDRPSGVFAGGDMVPAERSVTVAIGHGKKAARNIDAWLRDSAYEPPPKHEIAMLESLATWYLRALDLLARGSTW